MDVKPSKRLRELYHALFEREFGCQPIKYKQPVHELKRSYSRARLRLELLCLRQARISLFRVVKEIFRSSSVRVRSVDQINYLASTSSSCSRLFAFILSPTQRSICARACWLKVNSAVQNFGPLFLSAFIASEFR